MGCRPFLQLVDEWTRGGDTEHGMYELNNVKNPTNNASIARNADAWNAAGGVAIASEDEWYKAAYYDPTKNNGTGGYWKYPMKSDGSPSTADANFSGTGLTDVGHYAGKTSYYGTFDQGGNVCEWNDIPLFMNLTVVCGAGRSTTC